VREPRGDSSQGSRAGAITTAVSAERTIVVGDIHGCLRELEALLAEVALSPDDLLVSVGDLVGKGPLGAEVVRFFRRGDHLAVVGNHDLKLLEHHHGARTALTPSHARDAAALRRKDWLYLESLPHLLELPEHDAVVVHGGLLPDAGLDAQPARWAVNLRSIRPDGSPSKRVDDGEPWAKLWPGPELAIFGHDAIRGHQRWPHAIGLDTGCVYGGSLSALILPERRIVSVESATRYQTFGES
jgi:hypothetical protein